MWEGKRVTDLRRLSDDPETANRAANFLKATGILSPNCETSSEDAL